MEDFEALLEPVRPAVERYVHFRISVRADAEDVLQEVYLTAYQKFPQLNNPDSFRPWVMSIARNKCNDHYRTRAAHPEISLDRLSLRTPCRGGLGIHRENPVREAMACLEERERQILVLFFWQELSQAEIARRLSIPLGTVKSRLHTAKRKFREAYPYPARTAKGETTMKTFPAVLPPYRIEEIDEPAFPVTFEELPNWFIVPRTGEEITWASYDMPGRNLTETVHSRVVSPAVLHGIAGVEIQTECLPQSSGAAAPPPHLYYAQLTDTHCRWLGESYVDSSGVRRLLTFLDGEEFMAEWGYGEENCGREIRLAPGGKIVRRGQVISVSAADFAIDAVSRCVVQFADAVYNTVCLVEYSGDVLVEQYLDRSGRTVLWRRFNRNDWAKNRYGRLWTELLPDNERLTINGEVFVHWYDCITDYIL